MDFTAIQVIARVAHVLQTLLVLIQDSVGVQRVLTGTSPSDPVDHVAVTHTVVQIHSVQTVPLTQHHNLTRPNVHVKRDIT